MFNKNKPNIIILSDKTEMFYMFKLVGPHQVASALRHAGFEVAVINHLHTFSLNDIKNMLHQLVNENTLYVGFSTFFYENIQDFISTDGVVDPDRSINFAKHIFQKLKRKELGSMLPHGVQFNKEIQQLVKQANPKCALVLGGVDAQDFEYTKDYDYVTIGYSDTSAVNLAQHLHTGVPLLNSRRSLFGPTMVDDRTASTYPFTTTPLRYESHDCILPGETLAIELGRGCIFRCGFCSYPLNGKKKLDYLKHEEILRQEFMDNYQRFGVTRYYFSDDTFNDSKEKLEMVLRISKSLPFKLEYWAYIRVDLLAAHPDTLDMLVESGWRAAYCGIETLHERAASIVGKGGSRQRVLDTLARVKREHGDLINLHGSFILGLPEEPVESIQRTCDRLVNGDVAVDSWSIIPFILFNKAGTTYHSEFDTHYEKYGYEITGSYPGSNIMPWRNQFTTYEEMMQLRIDTEARGKGSSQANKLHGLASFYIAGLGFDLDYAHNKDVNIIPWHDIVKQKQKRIKEYRALLEQQLDIKLGP
jgi:radical SAM superfamily enzyme YgiQ (UPF0313 family)